ncbi:MAG: hypothetical protein ACOZAP_01000 [Pseudomonadota bacterium]|jgi:hypothetical protein
MSLSREAVLAELGIPRWRARPGVAFPGGPVQDRAPCLPRVDPSVGAACGGDVAVVRDTSGPQVVDILLLAEAATAAEVELLARMAEAVRGLRPGLQVGTAGFVDASQQGRVSVRLDGEGLPSLAAMVADPALKRPVWQALKDAVARLP